MQSKAQALSILEEVYTACNQVFDKKICDAFLYGSFARGDQHEASDVDILLTVEEAPEALLPYRMALAHICSELGLAHDIMVSATVKSAAQFRQYAGVLPYYQNVLKEGIRYAAG